VPSQHGILIPSHDRLLCGAQIREHCECDTAVSGERRAREKAGETRGGPPYGECVCHDLSWEDRVAAALRGLTCQPDLCIRPVLRAVRGW
jgi:hypothetical protein